MRQRPPCLTRRPAPRLAHRRGRATTAPMICVLLAMGLAAGCGLSGHGPARPVPARPVVPGFRHGLSLVLTQNTLRQLQAAAPALAARELRNPATLVLIPSPRVLHPPLPPLTRNPAGRAQATLGATFTSYTAFSTALARHQIPSGVTAVAYDPELWTATPLAEQANPRRYMSLFAAAAHRHGYAVILMPGRDILLARGATCPKRPGEQLDTAFLRCGLPSDAARLSQAVVIQTAPVEMATAEVREFAAACAQQVRASNPAAVLIATLSTRPGRRPVTGRQLAGAAAAIRPFVQGFLLNMTAQSVRAARAFLQTVPARPS
jgi:hypothetical protein